MDTDIDIVDLNIDIGECVCVCQFLAEVRKIV